MVPAAGDHHPYLGWAGQPPAHFSVAGPAMASPLLLPGGMAEPESQNEVSRKVVYETTSSSSTGTSVTAWVIIGVLALALILYIVMKLT